MVDTVGIVGLGLIGGSLARRLTERGVRVVAWNHRSHPYAQAEADGIFCKSTLSELMDAEPDVVVLCNPLKAMPSILAALAPLMGDHPNTTLTDVGSVKGMVRDQVKAAGLGKCYVGAHPMAGNELSGWQAACVALALGTVLLVLYGVELCCRYRAMARLAADIDAVLHGSGDIHLADYGEGEVSLLRSEVRKMTLRLREQSAQLEKEKLQLADAMADISHQMRTPLTAVNLLLTSLAGHVDEESRGDVRALRRQVARMDWLVESLLKLAKLDAGTARFCPETIPLSALLARAAEPFAIGMELRGQQLQVEASGNVRCDPAWTAEALGNILKNCSEHMQEGTITVRAEENAVASVVVIRDTGGGIAPQDLPHLFERYYKGENAPEQSVGIGLALSRSIAAAQNGTLTAANVPGGAEFTMKLYKGIV